MVLFGLGSDVAQQNPKFPKIGFTLPDKKVFKMLVRKSKIIWQRSWSLVLNIYGDLCFRLGEFQASVAYKSVAHKKNV